VLAQLFLNPTSALHVRELARRTDSQPGTLNRELHKLAAAGLLLQTKVGNQVQYQANRACPIFDDLTNLLRKTDGIAGLVAEAIVGLEGVECALIFGSVARGEETAYSDVDVLILGNVLFGSAVEALYEVQAKLAREINPAVYPVEDFRQRLAHGDTWAHEVASKPKLFLVGNVDDFTELIGHQTPDSV
jgi:predicted nucleotidyltransferase